jgi:phenylalanyl-tRNA synthetase alpha chain
MPLLSPGALAAALAVPDLTDPRQGPHAVQLVVDAAVAALRDAWGVPVDVHRGHPVVPVEDNYDRLGYPPDAVARDARYTRYVSETCVLRSHTSAMVPAALRALAGRAGAPAAHDTLVACPGIVYRRDAIDRLHTGTPHQLDLWRVCHRRTTDDDLLAMIDTVLAAVLPGRQWRVSPVEHPYTDRGREIEVLDARRDRWIEVGECGLASRRVLARCGLADHHGLAMGIGLDRIVMVRKGMDDIRLLRASDRRIASQLTDLEPYRPVSSRPAVVRDLSLAVAADQDAETIGDRVREALGDHAGFVEDLAVLAETPGYELPAAAASRLGRQEGQKNVLLRVVLRPVDHTLTNAEANVLRDRIYAAVHEGRAREWSTGGQRRGNAAAAGA